MSKRLMIPRRSSTFFDSRTFVAGLFTWRRPPAIRWLIVAIYIYTIEAVPWCWLAAHVIKEIFIIVYPTLTYRNTATAVMPIPYSLRGITSKQHVIPSFPFWGI